MEEDLSFRGNNPGAVRYGNYINYYKFHPPETRIESLSTVPLSIWNFQTNSNYCVALDIGCNSGDLTKQLYKFYSQLQVNKHIIVLGVDIDPKLIERAQENYHEEYVTFQCINIMHKPTKDILIRFLQKYDKNQFDIITCFSTTMWIHLNHGDEGLKSFLRLVCELGSFLIIEPQPWSRYREAVRRLKKEFELFPMYEQLKIRSNVESEIENVIVNNENFQKIHETSSLGWARKVLIFQKKR